MASLKTIRTALKTRLDSALSDVQVYSKVPDTPVLPSIVIVPENIEYQVVQGGDTHGDFTFAVVVILSRTEEAGAQDAADDFVSPDGAKSIAAAIAGDSTLGGAVDYALATAMSRYGTFNFNGTEYIGAQIDVEVSA